MEAAQDLATRARDTIGAALAQVGSSAGRTLLVHSNTDVLDELMPDEDLVTRLGEFEGALRASIGTAGTLVVPTFTYGFCRGRPFDPDRTNSHVGLFTNYLRRRPDALRSRHPIFSFAAVGANTSALLADVPETAFGPDSVFDRLRALDALIVFFNCSFTSCTYVHHIEQLYGVGYRYEKIFRAPIIENGRARDGQATFFVRDLDRDVVNGFDRFSAGIAASGLLRTAKLGSGKVSAVGAQALFAAGTRALQAEPYIFLAHPPTPVAAPNRS
jgi:aminoglycoside 3-N-acetyltransferase